MPKITPSHATCEHAQPGGKCSKLPISPKKEQPTRLSPLEKYS